MFGHKIRPTQRMNQIIYGLSGISARAGNFNQVYTSIEELPTKDFVGAFKHFSMKKAKPGVPESIDEQLVNGEIEFFKPYRVQNAHSIVVFFPGEGGRTGKILMERDESEFLVQLKLVPRMNLGKVLGVRIDGLPQDTAKGLGLPELGAERIIFVEGDDTCTEAILALLNKGGEVSTDAAQSMVKSYLEWESAHSDGPSTYQAVLDEEVQKQQDKQPKMVEH